VSSRTKQALGDASRHRLLAESLGPRAGVAAWAELTDGTFNTTFRVTVGAGADDPATAVVVKVAPRPDLALLTYERDLLRTEALFDTLAERHTSVPVPAVVHAGFERVALDGDYLVLSALPGRPLSTVDGRLAPGRRRRLRADLGGHLAALHRITGDTFGYPQRAAGLQGDTWREAFVAMVDAVLEDARRFDVALPLPAAAIRGVVADHAGALDLVRVPVLTHFDLWDGNILVTGVPDGERGGGDGEARIAGLIDAERAFWGDPLADVVSLTLLRDLDGDDPLLVGYREGGGHLELDAPGRRRLHLYRAYLDLIMIVEAAPRGYDPVEHTPVRRMCEAHLRRQLRALAGG
jgi:aminoglycoside phosphotransferase (APT) family kinase protein